MPFPKLGKLTETEYNRWMQIVTYAVVALITCGLLVGVGYLYKFDKINPSDGILIYILGQFITALVSITSKIHRINIGTKEPEKQNPE
jgi:uncharacterized membrane protein YjjP (DUF1212 family)